MKPKGRPKKKRIVRQSPRISQFSPRGRPGRPDEARLTIDELEAIRLADYQGMSQKEAAQSMQVSQQTFSRILERAHKAIADSLVSGKIIRIQGGPGVIESVQNFPPKPTQKESQKQPAKQLQKEAKKTSRAH